MVVIDYYLPDNRRGKMRWSVILIVLPCLLVYLSWRTPPPYQMMTRRFTILKVANLAEIGFIIRELSVPVILARAHFSIKCA